MKRLENHWLFKVSGVIETTQLICSANQLTGFCMMGTLVIKGLNKYGYHYQQARRRGLLTESDLKLYMKFAKEIKNTMAMDSGRLEYAFI